MLFIVSLRVLLQKLKVKKTILKHLLIITVAAAVMLLFNLLHIDCPVRFATGIPCPACGMTRAMLSLLTGDCKGYFYYNAMALPMTLLLAVGIHKDKLHLNRTVTNIVLIVGAAAVFAYYVYRLYYGIIP